MSEPKPELRAVLAVALVDECGNVEEVITREGRSIGEFRGQRVDYHIPVWKHRAELIKWAEVGEESLASHLDKLT